MEFAFFSELVKRRDARAGIAREYLSELVKKPDPGSFFEQQLRGLGTGGDVLEKLAAAGHDAFLAFQEGKVAGVIAFQRKPGKAIASYHTRLEPQHRGKKLAALFWEKFLEVKRAEGVEIIELGSFGSQLIERFKTHFKRVGIERIPGTNTWRVLK